MIYRELDGTYTIWRGKHVGFLRRILYKLYRKYINEPFIPKDSSFHISHYPLVFKKEGIQSIRVGFKGLNTGRFEDYIFAEFHKITEQ